jgi:hypothetical protein
MTDSSFDRVTRLLAGSRSRRQTLAALGALAAARLQVARAVTQVEIAACGEAGAVCTPIAGCCSGLVCATSTLNPAYGVCVTGEGDMLPVTNDLVVPGSEGITEELAGQASEAAAATTEGESLLAAQEAEIQSRRTARNTRQSTRRTQLQSNRNTQQSRKATNRTERRTRKDLNRLNRVPQLELELSADAGEPEIVIVRNRGRASVLLASIESREQAGIFEDLSVTIAPGDTYRLVSDQSVADFQTSGSGNILWTTKSVCPEGKGVFLTVAKFGGTKSHQLTVLCGEKVSTRGGVDAASQPQKKQQKPQGQLQSKRGKGR